MMTKGFPESIQVYRVGGCVRDELLGVREQDIDFVVVGASSEDLLQRGFKQVGVGFPVFLNPVDGNEYALARKERKEGVGHTGFHCDFGPEVSLEEDLLRRDLTINAMAMDSAGNVIDPHGGQSDLASRTLRHVSEAFAEDPLRVLRVARFMSRYAKLGFEIAPETMHIMRAIAHSGDLHALTAERMWAETQKALQSDTPVAFFEALRTCGALGQVFPEVDRLFGVPQPAAHHPEVDTGIHTLLALAQATSLSDRVDVRFAVLTHDLGKAQTPSAELPRHIGHEAAGVPLVEGLCDRLKVPGRERALARLVCEQHLRVHRACDLRPGSIMDLIEVSGALRDSDRFEGLLLACEADARGRTGLENRDYPQAQHLRECLEVALSVDVHPIVERCKEKGGDAIGRRLREARVRAITTIVQNRRQANAGVASPR